MTKQSKAEKRICDISNKIAKTGPDLINAVRQKDIKKGKAIIAECDRLARELSEAWKEFENTEGIT
jgi:flagellin-specific chaperone FliS